MAELLAITGPWKVGGAHLRLNLWCLACGSAHALPLEAAERLVYALQVAEWSALGARDDSQGREPEPECLLVELGATQQHPPNRQYTERCVAEREAAADGGAGRAVSGEPCTAETWSWNHFTPNQMDPYWIRCTLAIEHDRHEDQNTGLTWPVE